MYIIGTEKVPLNYANFYDCACSGTAGTLILVAQALAQRGHEVIILNQSVNGVFKNIKHFKILSDQECMSTIQELGEVDVFIANRFSAKIFLSHRILAKCRVYWLHNFIDINPYIKAIDEKRLDYICCVSQAHLEAFWRCQRYERFFFVHNPICAQELHKIAIPDARDKKVMFVGAPRQNKGFHDVLRLFSAFHKKHPDYNIICCWGGESSPYG